MVGAAELTELCALARKHGTDKSGHHEYTPIYHSLMGAQRDDVKAVLEIGIGYQCHHVGGSAHMWEEYFPHARVIMLDSNAEVFINEGRIESYAADQANAQSLLQAMAKVDTKFDLIVDDGSHETSHQITSMLTLLPFLAEGGFYVVEDLQHDCRPEEVGDHVPPGYRWESYVCPAPVGCGCGCGQPERLLVVWHA